jgi:HAD superfamily hydrolase (TIGR01459 family)
MTLDFKIFPSLESISDGFSGILLDAYGVFWQGNDVGVFPFSEKAMEREMSNGKIVGILSNSTQLSAKEIKKLALRGLIQGKHFHFLITSGEVTRDYFLNKKLPFKTSRKKFFLFGGVHPKFSSHEDIFKDTEYCETLNIDEADFIFISIPHINGEDQLDKEIFRKEVEKVKLKNLPMICANPDRFAHEGKPPRAVVRQGSIAQMYEEMGGKVFYMGKPYREAYSFAMKQFLAYNLTDPSRVLMVGDTPETDIRGARAFGMASALVTQTGIMADRISLQGLEKALRALYSSDTPDYFIKGLL